MPEHPVCQWIRNLITSNGRVSPILTVIYNLSGKLWVGLTGSLRISREWDFLKLKKWLKKKNIYMTLEERACLSSCL